jgi:putative ABC transport system permease protein
VQPTGTPDQNAPPPGFVSAMLLDYGSIIYDSQFLVAIIYQDYLEILNDQTYAGRNPAHPNEAAISGLLGYEKGKLIGDTILLLYGGREEEYIITGFFQSSNNLGRESLLTADGFRLLNPDFKEQTICIRLDEGADCGQYVEHLEQRYGGRVSNIQNDREFLNMQLSAILAMIYSLTAAICIITALVIAFILFLVVRTMVLRRKKEFGIQKAVGFTTFQLMNQVACSFVPVAILGTGAGSVAGSLAMNDCIRLLFRGVGIMKVDFLIPVPIIAVVTVLICLLVYVVSLLVSARIRHLSAYSLFVG